jgi:hypothetical protein
LPGELLEASQGSVPECIDEVADAGKAIKANRVDVSDAILARLYKTGIFQHAQVTGHGGPAHWKSSGDIANRQRAGPQFVQYRASYGISEGI